MVVLKHGSCPCTFQPATEQTECEGQASAFVTPKMVSHEPAEILCILRAPAPQGIRVSYTGFIAYSKHKMQRLFKDFQGPKSAVFHHQNY